MEASVSFVGQHSFIGSAQREGQAQYLVCSCKKRSRHAAITSLASDWLTASVGGPNMFQTQAVSQLHKAP